MSKLPQVGDQPPVYNLIVLVHQSSNGPVTARAANLDLDVVHAAAPREAIGQIVTRAKAVLAEHVTQGTPINWIDPPLESNEGESRMLVPLHL